MTYGKWESFITYDVVNGGWIIGIWKFLHDGRRVGLVGLTPQPNLKIFEKDEPMEPIRLPADEGTGILEALASALARTGYGALDQTPATRAKDAHIESLEKQTERFYNLACGFKAVP